MPYRLPKSRRRAPVRKDKRTLSQYGNPLTPKHSQSQPSPRWGEGAGIELISIFSQLSSHRYGRGSEGEFGPALQPCPHLQNQQAYWSSCGVSSRWSRPVFLAFSWLRTPGRHATAPGAHPATEGVRHGITGTVDLGYRWTAGFRGNDDISDHSLTWGEAEVVRANLNFANALGTGKYLDRLQINASSWGGDPHTPCALCREKRMSINSRSTSTRVNYFNPFRRLQPLTRSGLLLDSILSIPHDARGFELTLRPGATISPFWLLAKLGIRSGTRRIPPGNERVPVNTNCKTR